MEFLHLAFRDCHCKGKTSARIPLPGMASIGSSPAFDSVCMIQIYAVCGLLSGVILILAIIPQGLVVLESFASSYQSEPLSVVLTREAGIIVCIFSITEMSR